MDKKYWEKYYTKQRIELYPSLFAQHILKNHIGNTQKYLVELGCGNGRDSIYFAEEGLNVLAIDQAESEINFLRNRFNANSNLTFTCDDFTNLEQDSMFDIVYSRFTLHSINLIQQKRVLNWSYNQLNENGFFCIEVRGKKNDLYQKGEKVADEKDAYIHDNHYRRFLEFDAFCNELKASGFTIEYSKESKGFAPFKNTDETFIRVIAIKRTTE